MTGVENATSWVQYNANKISYWNADVAWVTMTPCKNSKNFLLWVPPKSMKLYYAVLTQIQAEVRLKKNTTCKHDPRDLEITIINCPPENNKIMLDNFVQIYTTCILMIYTKKC